MTGFRLVCTFVVFIGAGMSMSLLWNLADVFMGIMALINIPVIFILSNTAFKVLKDYEHQKKQGRNPVFHSESVGLKGKTDFWE